MQQPTDTFTPHIINRTITNIETNIIPFIETFWWLTNKKNDIQSTTNSQFKVQTTNQTKKKVVQITKTTHPKLTYHWSTWNSNFWDHKSKRKLTEH